MNGTHPVAPALKLKSVDAGGNCGARAPRARGHGPHDSSLARYGRRRLTADFYRKREFHFHRCIRFEKTFHPKEHAGTADVFRAPLVPLVFSVSAITYLHVYRKSRGSLRVSLRSVDHCRLLRGIFMYAIAHPGEDFQ